MHRGPMVAFRYAKTGTNTGGLWSTTRTARLIVTSPFLLVLRALQTLILPASAITARQANVNNNTMIALSCATPPLTTVTGLACSSITSKTPGAVHSFESFEASSSDAPSAGDMQSDFAQTKD